MQATLAFTLPGEEESLHRALRAEQLVQALAGYEMWLKELERTHTDLGARDAFGLARNQLAQRLRDVEVDL